MQAYQVRDLHTALLEAEELLDEEPDNLTALQLLGDTELDLGHGHEAALVFEHLVELDAGVARFWGGLAVARFLVVDFAGALEAADRALALDAGLAEAVAYRGLALERLGRLEEAGTMFHRASRLDPKAYPLPVPERRIPWGDLLQAALARIPKSLSYFFRNTALVWQRYPDPEVLQASTPTISPLVLALYEGAPGAETDPAQVLPRSIRLFKGNAARYAHDMERLEEDLAYSLMAEATDWLGLPMPHPEEEE